MIFRCQLSSAAAVVFSVALLSSRHALADTGATNEYTAVNAIFTEHCLDCHGSQDPEGHFVLEDFDSLMKGGEIGTALVPGHSDDSLLVKMIEGKFQKDGKTKIMPPGKRKKLEPTEIAAIRSWIDAGAHGPPAGTVVQVRELVVPKIIPKITPRMPIISIACSPVSLLMAVATYGSVELRSPESHTPPRILSGHHGNVNAVLFSPDGSELFGAAGQPGLAGEVRQWNVADGKLIRVFEGHKDAIYSAALSPDGKTLATGSYDQKIKLWNVETGREIRTLSGHNGAIYSLAFRPDGKILASGSGDHTVKLWDVASGERRDTLSQPLKDLYAVAFSPDGKRLVAGGVDHRIRIWEISEDARETTNPLLDSKYAHEGTILNLVFSSDGRWLLSSADDRTVKVWDAHQMKEKLLLETQPDWAHALAFIDGGKIIAVGRMDGTLGFYDTLTGKAARA